MKVGTQASLRVAAVMACTAALVTSASRAQVPAPPPPPTSGRSQDASLDGYRRHLVTLAGLTQVCAKARDVKSCDPLLVGLDDRVPLGAHGERRLMRYGWLRVLFSRAEEGDEAQQAPKSTKPETNDESVRPKPRTTSQLLQDAVARLEADLAQAGASSTPPPDHTKEHATMQEVLAGGEFRRLKQPDATDSLLEQFNRWLNRLFEGVGKLRTRSARIGRALIWGFLLGVGVGLAWLLLQLERRWRIRLLPLSEAPAPEAASARDWQLWMADARKAAELGLWREGIHFLYWAVISRLESRRLWPADRARTAREYLALMAPDDSRKPGLSSLTSTFERVWYGGRPAHEGDYRRAAELAATLIAGTGAADPAHASGVQAAAGSTAQ